MSRLKKITVVLAALAAVGLAAIFLFVRPEPKVPTPMSQDQKTVVLKIGATAVVAEVADTGALHAQGLSNRSSLEEGRGMWFVFEEDGLWSFWMKDTLIPLDMIWVSATGTIVHIAHEVQPESYPAPYAPTSPARYVLEVPGGFAKKMGIAEGQKVVVQ
jgi:uncharacterized membrane protein (UPF0127 family)